MLAGAFNASAEIYARPAIKQIRLEVVRLDVRRATFFVCGADAEEFVAKDHLHELLLLAARFSGECGCSRARLADRRLAEQIKRARKCAPGRCLFGRASGRRPMRQVIGAPLQPHPAHGPMRTRDHSPLHGTMDDQCRRWSADDVRAHLGDVFRCHGIACSMSS